MVIPGEVGRISLQQGHEATRVKGCAHVAQLKMAECAPALNCECGAKGPPVEKGQPCIADGGQGQPVAPTGVVLIPCTRTQTPL